MSASQRNKGNAGERQLLKLLSDELGFVVRRNLSQTRGGGADCIEIPGWSPEVKRQEILRLKEWWQQTLDQCREGEKPALFYRANYMPWMAMMRLCDVNSDLVHDYTVTMNIQAACLVIRESL